MENAETLGLEFSRVDAKKAAGLLAELKRNHASGKGQQTLAEMRRMEQDKREQAERERELCTILKPPFQVNGQPGKSTDPDTWF